MAKKRFVCTIAIRKKKKQKSSNDASAHRSSNLDVLKFWKNFNHKMEMEAKVSVGSEITFISAHYYGKSTCSVTRHSFQYFKSVLRVNALGKTYSEIMFSLFCDENKVSKSVDRNVIRTFSKLACILCCFRRKMQYAKVTRTL